MAYDPKAIANYFLDVAEKKAESLTPMKLQKLVYFGHGWHLGLLRAPLLNEQIQAWSFGPVIRSLWKEFEEFGASPITRRAIDYKFRSGTMSVITSTPAIDSTNSDLLVKRLLDRIWEIYGGYSATQLSNMTHEAGTPWHRVSERYGGNIPKYTTIPEEWIQEYFEALGKRE